MSTDDVLYETSDGIATITINRPDKLNALNVAVVTALREFMEKAESDDNIRVIILTGTGEKAFAAGADITGFLGKDGKTIRPLCQGGQDFCTYIESMSKPVIAAINGFALGGGCEIAMACDIRYASSNAKLGQPEINLGIIPGFGGTVRLPRLVGLGKAKELIYSGFNISADEALQIGLVEKVFEDVSALREGVLKMATTLSKKPGVAIKLAKKSLNAAWTMPLHDNLKLEVDVFCETFDTEDKDIGVKAFLNKEKPEFKHK